MMITKAQVELVKDYFDGAYPTPKYASAISALIAVGERLADGSHVILPRNPAAPNIGVAEGYCDFVMPEGFENTPLRRVEELRCGYSALIDTYEHPERYFKAAAK